MRCGSDGLIQSVTLGSLVSHLVRVMFVFVRVVDE
jgi:hypothetical protein